MVKSEVANLIIKLKNAGLAGQTSTFVAYSKFAEAILTVLQEKGYITSFSKKGKKVIKTIDVELKYENGQPKISEVELLSKLSRRLYAGAEELRPVKNGYGLLLVSTSKGVLAGGDARKANLGGELLCKVW